MRWRYDWFPDNHWITLFKYRTEDAESLIVGHVFIYPLLELLGLIPASRHLDFLTLASFSFPSKKTPLLLPINPVALGETVV